MHVSKSVILLIVLSSLSSVLAIEEKNSTALAVSDSSLRQSKCMCFYILKGTYLIIVYSSFWYRDCSFRKFAVCL